MKDLRTTDGSGVLVTELPAGRGRGAIQWLGRSQSVPAQDFGPVLAQALRQDSARFVHLLCLPTTAPGQAPTAGPPAAPDARAPAGEGWAVALWERQPTPSAPGSEPEEDGAGQDADLEAVAAPLVPTLTRPSAAGVWSALLEEERLARAGVHWAEPAPARAVRGRGIFVFPLGPVRADAAESLLWRLQVMGDEVVGLDLRFGYKPRHLEERFSALEPAAGVEIAERVTGTSPVAHALAYAMAWEAMGAVAVPPAARWWRGVLAELERLYSHVGDLANLANATGLPAAAAELFVLKEQALRLCEGISGHRYQRGVVGIGGLRKAPAWPSAFGGWLGAWGARLQAVVRQLQRSTSFLDRLHGAGWVRAELAAAWGAVGPVGRATGRPYDVRSARPYGLYAEVGAPAPVLHQAGDAWARYRVRVEELEASLCWLLERAREGPPPGPHQTRLEAPGPSVRPGSLVISRVEAPRGELIYVLGGAAGGAYWVRLRTPSAVNWPLVPPAVAERNVMQDVPIIEASFGLSVAAFDR